VSQRAVIYARTSTVDQHTENQVYDLEQLARQRGLEIIKVYRDQVSGTRARRPGLDQLLSDARQGKFDVVLVWACDRLARSVSHFLTVLDELGHLHIEFISYREQLDTTGPLGRAVVVIISAIAELERSLIVERVRAGLRRAKLEGRRLGRPPLLVDREAVRRDRQQGLSISQLAKQHGIAETSVRRLLRQPESTPPKTLIPPPPQVIDNAPRLSAV
jgi:DNA invertase Pin-like site-specific DNA recombinase